MFGFLGSVWDVVFGKREAPDGDVVDTAPTAKRRRTVPEEPECEEPSEVEDDAYDALKISKTDAKLLNSLGVMSLTAIEKVASARQEQLDAYDDEIEEVDSMNLKALRALLKKYDVAASTSSLEAAKEQAEDVIVERRERLENENESPAKGFLLAMQIDWTPDLIQPLPLHIFKTTYGCFSTGKLEVILPQQACLDDKGAWLKSKKTKADLKNLETFYNCIQAAPSEEDQRDRYRVEMRSDGDANVVPIIAPMSAQCKGMTQEAFEKLDEEEKTEVVCSCLRIGDVLREYLVLSHDALQAIDWKLEEESERTGREPEEIEDDWDGALEAAIEDLVVSAEEEPLHYLVTEQDTMSDNPYFAVGISPNGNMLGYVTNLVWT